MFAFFYLSLFLIASEAAVREIHHVSFGARVDKMTANTTAIAQIPTHDVIDELLRRRLPGHVDTFIKDINTGGLEGLNFRFGLPFKLDQYIAGFKIRLGSLRNAITNKSSRYHLTPLLDTLYGKTTIDTPVFPGTANIEVDYKVDSRTLYTHTRWASKERDFEIVASVDTDNLLTDIGFEISVSNTTERTRYVATVPEQHILILSHGDKNPFDLLYCLPNNITNHRLRSVRVSLDANYDLKNAKLDGSTKIAIGDNAVKFTLDHVVKVSHKIDSRNVISPSISLKNGARSLGWKHLFATVFPGSEYSFHNITTFATAGSLDAEFSPSESLDLIWKDKATYGTWTATASIPVDDPDKTRLSIAHNWNY